MDKVHIYSHYDIKKEGIRHFPSDIIPLSVIVYLLGRTVVFDAAAPFGLALLAAYISSNKSVSWKYAAVTFLALLGIVTSGADIPIIKYMLAFVLFGLIYISVTTLTDSRKNLSISAMAGIAMFLSGIIFSAQTVFALYDIFMLALESVCCSVCAQLIQGALSVILSNFNNIRTAPRQTSLPLEKKAGLIIITILCVAGISGIRLGTVAIGDSLAAVLIMFLSLVAGVPGGAAGGVGIGIIFGISKFPLTDAVGAYSLCGLAAGALRRFNKAGVILGFFTVNTVLSIYLGGFDGGSFGILELFIAVIIFCAIPRSAIIQTEGLLSVKAGSAGNAKFITQKLNSVASALSSLANTFSSIVRQPDKENFADITTLFDKTADKVCRRCGLKFICWEKQFNSTYDSMMKLAPVFKSRDKALPSDLPQPFRSKCIKSDEFIAELNRIYSRHRLEMQWQQRIIESQELAAEQFNGISKIMNNIVNEIDNSTENESHIEKQLIVELEHAGLKKCDVTVIKNKYGRFEVSLKLKNCSPDKRCAETAIPIVSDVLKRKMDERDGTCAGVHGGAFCEVYLAEKERFSVACAAARRVKDGQTESGDNYNYMHICDGKYVIVLSDGMGSGKQAASQSNVTVTMLEQLLGAGFDKSSAIKIINSALLIKTSDECFTTIDIAIIDLFDGQAEFIKIGANSTYLKHKKRVEQIKSTSLPAGILKDVDVETSNKCVESGDYIIMLSDGIHGAADNWISDFISRLKNNDPKSFADEILHEAVRRKKNVIDDDMTVIAAKLLES